MESELFLPPLLRTNPRHFFAGAAFLRAFGGFPSWFKVERWRLYRFPGVGFALCPALARRSVGGRGCVRWKRAGEEGGRESAAGRRTGIRILMVSWLFVV